VPAELVDSYSENELELVLLDVWPESSILIDTIKQNHGLSYAQIMLMPYGELLEEGNHNINDAPYWVLKRPDSDSYRLHIISIGLKRNSNPAICVRKRVTLPESDISMNLRGNELMRVDLYNLFSQISDLYQIWFLERPDIECGQNEIRL